MRIYYRCSKTQLETLSVETWVNWKKSEAFNSLIIESANLGTNDMAVDYSL